MQETLPVVEHMVRVYKTWYEYRDHLPKKSRYTLGDRVDSRFVQVLELLYVATYQSPAEKISTLGKALNSLDILKFLMRIAWELHLFDNAKYEKISVDLAEAGKQIGGWKKGLEKKMSPAARTQAGDN